MVGAGHVRVQVAADMNYNHTSTTSESYDPDSKVIRSTQTVEQNASDTNGSSQAAVSVSNALPNGANNGATAPGDSSKSTSGRTEETTNYEISKKVTTSTQDGGEVKHLSVAVVVDGTVTGSGASAPYKPRTQAEMAQITNLVKSAMGFDQARGDQVQVTNMAFARLDVADGSPAAKPLLGLDPAYWFKIIEAAIMCVTALLIGLFVARPLIDRMFAPNPTSRERSRPRSSAPRRWPAPCPRPAITRLPRHGAEGLAPIKILPSQPGIDLSQIEGQVREFLQQEDR